LNFRMKNRPAFLRIAFVAFISTNLSFGSAVPRVIQDIYPGAVPEGSVPREFARLGDRVLFSALQINSIGRELWITDGTGEGTRLVRDMRIGWSWGDPTEITELNGLALFAGDNGINGNELWITDGTPEGTRMLKDLDPGTLDGDPEFLVRFKDRIYFSAENDVNGQEVFVSDGTVEGTTVFVDLVPGPEDSDPEQLIVMGGLLFFIADLSDTGEELWVTDGTVEGTRLVKDIRPGDSDADIENLTVVGDQLYFQADDGTSGEELWVTNGTETGTRQVKDIRPGSSSSSPRELANVNGTLFFSASSSETGYELWKSDGTEAGTVLIKDIRTGNGGSSPSELTAIGDRVVFSANTDSASKEPWVSDGTESGTVMLKDIREGSDSSFPGDYTVVDGEVFFGIQLGADNYQLWKTDGTPEGTTEVAAVRMNNPGYAMNGKLLFAGAENEAINATELWISDGTAAGTHQVKNIALDLGSSSPDHVTAVGESVYFGALEGIEGPKSTRVYSLWKSSGFNSQTERMTYLTAQTNPGDLREIARLDDDTAIFSGRTDTSIGYELGISNGTPEGTSILKDIRPGNGSSTPNSFVLVDDELYFSADFRLSKTDGTESGSVEFSDIVYLRGVHALGGLYFQGNVPGTQDGQLWRFDPETNTAAEVAIINPDAYAQINYITEYKGNLYFSATDQGLNNFEYELWMSDGFSVANEVKDIRPGPEGSNPANLAVAGGFLFFAADDGTSGYELWRSDGTPDGTVLLKDILPGPDTSEIRTSSLFEYNGELFFVANDGTSGVELWKSDGTPEGTRLVKDIYPGPHSSVVPYEWQPVEYEGLLYFAALCPDYGYELWRTDGTPEGTRMAFDIYPGRDSSVPEQLTVAGGRLYFQAFSPLFGNELHVYDPDFVDVPIDIHVESDRVVLEWMPGPTRNLQLESFGAGGVWTPVSASPTVSDSVYSVSLAIGETSRLFRLVEP
jgi:ELWxxDGT repeat protein